MRARTVRNPFTSGPGGCRRSARSGLWPVESEPRSTRCSVHLAPPDLGGLRGRGITMMRRLRCGLKQTRLVGARGFIQAGNFRFEGLPRNRCTTARSPSNFIRLSNTRTLRGLIPSSTPACCWVICRFLTSCNAFSRSDPCLTSTAPLVVPLCPCKAELSTWLQKELLMWLRHASKSSVEPH